MRNCRCSLSDTSYLHRRFFPVRDHKRFGAEAHHHCIANSLVENVPRYSYGGCRVASILGNDLFVAFLFFLGSGNPLASVLLPSTAQKVKGQEEAPFRFQTCVRNKITCQILGNPTRRSSFRVTPILQQDVIEIFLSYLLINRYRFPEAKVITRSIPPLCAQPSCLMGTAAVMVGKAFLYMASHLAASTWVSEHRSEVAKLWVALIFHSPRLPSPRGASGQRVQSSAVLGTCVR